MSNFQQHKVEHKLVDLLVSDNSTPPWRKISFLDAIVADRKIESRLYN